MERVNYKGDILKALDEESVFEAIKTLKKEKVEAVAVSFLWSVVNASHERRVKEILKAELPEIPVVASSDAASYYKGMGENHLYHLECVCIAGNF